ncbi:MAG: 1,4-dihydroxy-6-naphthoate synthase, partial [Alistipes sp.]|nr:1,4-dihydroxy-6-naphthoate synthase [Alistipes sp.]
GTKISYAILPRLEGKYRVCNRGSALGRGNGPLLVARRGYTDKVKQALHNGGDLKIAVPGLNTTANLLLSRLFPPVKHKAEILFSEIAGEVSSGYFDAGILIHEGRFTYREKGLEALYDLGLEWEKTTSLPLPLGGIVISREVPLQSAILLDSLLKKSIRFAFDNPSVSREYVKSYAQEMEDSVIESHIGLFVNHYSLSLGHTGRRAITELTGIGPGIFL